MSRAERALIWILLVMELVRGVDYLTGNQNNMGAGPDDGLSMPFVWGVACVVASLIALIGVLSMSRQWVINGAIASFAVNAMLAWQVFESRMLPIPWPPEDTRVIVDHLGHAAIWALIAGVVWWRGGVQRRSSEIVKEQQLNGY